MENKHIAQIISLIIAGFFILLGIFRYHFWWSIYGFIFGLVVCGIWRWFGGDHSLIMKIKRGLGYFGFGTYFIGVITLVHHWMIGYILLILMSILIQLNIVTSLPVVAAFTLSFSGALIIDDFPDIGEDIDLH